MNVKLYKTVLFLLFIVLFSSCLNGKKIGLKYHDFDYEFVLYDNDLYFHVDLFFLKEYFEDNSFIRMSYFVDSLVLNNAKYIDVSLLYNDLQKNSFLISEYEILIIVSLQKKRVVIIDQERNKINQIRVEKSRDYKYRTKAYYYGDTLIIKSSAPKKNKINVY